MDTVKILDRYSAGDEFQRPIESAIEEITTLRQRVTELEKEQVDCGKLGLDLCEQFEKLTAERDDLLAALDRLIFESEEYEFDDGMGRGALQMYWDELHAAIASVKEEA